MGVNLSTENILKNMFTNFISLGSESPMSSEFQNYFLTKKSDISSQDCLQLQKSPVLKNSTKWREKERREFTSESCLIKNTLLSLNIKCPNPLLFIYFFSFFFLSLDIYFGPLLC